MEKRLEEIFWEEGKFQKKNGEEVNLIPIGKPISLRRGDPRHIKEKLERFELPKLIKKDKFYQEANAYLEGAVFIPYELKEEKPRIFYSTYCFYKI